MSVGRSDDAVGSDADIVVIDHKKPRLISVDTMELRSGFEPYHGYEVTGWPTTVISCGEMIIDDGNFVSTPGRSRFVRRSRFSARIVRGRWGVKAPEALTGAYPAG